jgi:hypothetical protein
MNARSLAYLVPVVLVAAVLLAGEEPRRVAADEPLVNPISQELYQYSAISEVIRANNGQAPKDGVELVAALAKVGDFAQLPVPFSAVALDSGLLKPRVILAPRPGLALPQQPDDPDLVGPPPPRDCEPTVPSPLSAAKLTQPHLEGRLFLAANMAGDSPAKLRVHTIEFISWNTRKKAFDFGVIDCSVAKPEVQFLDGVRCIACHKNRGPILGQGPWSNTTHNDVVRVAALHHILSFDRELRIPVPSIQPGVLGFPQVSGELRTRTTFDGMSFVAGEPVVCDSAIRTGGNLARDREIFKTMTGFADGRKALALLLTAIASDQPIAIADQRLVAALNRTFIANYSTFARKFTAIQKAMSSTLSDFSPSGSMGKLRTVVTNQPASWGSGSSQRTDITIVWMSTPEKVTEYDRLRAGGEHGMPSDRLPSNPRSFFRPDLGVPQRPANAVSTISLAATIGLAESDRGFMAKKLAELATRIDRQDVTPATLASELFSSPPFAKAIRTGNIPDREEFKDLFVEGLAAVARNHKVEPLSIARGDYASGPSGAAEPGQEYREPAIVPTTACRRCHDVAGPAKPPVFNPIPVLAFDPFEENSRAAWLKATRPRDRVAVLARMTRRLVTDQDMPPEDSAEYALFREKDAAAFDAVRDWLAAELRKAKGE